MRVTGEAENGIQAINMSQTEPYDLVLLDISLPDKHGVEVLKQLKVNHPAVIRTHAQHAC